MARINSKGNVVGAIGMLTFRELYGKNIVQTKGRKPRQTDETKKAALDFGYASRNSKVIRLAICEVIYKNHDKDFFRRFTTITNALLKQNTEFMAGKRTFFNTDMQGLVGFEFNLNSHYRKHCNLPIEITTLETNRVIVKIDSFVPQDCFSFAKKACEIKLDLTLISTNLQDFTTLDTKNFSIDIVKNKVVPAQEWLTEITLKESFTVIIAEIWFSQNTLAGKKVVINNKDFHPSSIIYVNNGMKQ